MMSKKPHLRNLDISQHTEDFTVHTPYVVATGTNAYGATIQGVTNLVEGMSFKIKFQNASTNNPTLNINELGAISIIKSNGNPASIKAGQVVHLVYTGSNFQLLGEGGEYGNVTPNDVKVGVTFGTDEGIKTGTFTSDATAVAGDILSEKTAYVNGNKITGSMANRGSLGTITPGTSNKSYSNGYYNAFTVAGDPNLIPANIKKGVSIFGVNGAVTLQSLGGKNIHIVEKTDKIITILGSYGSDSSVGTSSYSISGIGFVPNQVYAILYFRLDGGGTSSDNQAASYGNIFLAYGNSYSLVENNQLAGFRYMTSYDVYGKSKITNVSFGTTTTINFEVSSYGASRAEYFSYNLSARYFIFTD